MYGHKKSRSRRRPVRLSGNVCRCKGGESFWNVQGGEAEMCRKTCILRKKKGSRVGEGLSTPVEDKFQTLLLV